MTQKFGVGVESEGFLLDNEGNPVSKIDNLPASEWTMNKFTEKHPSLAENLGFKQASVMLEVKSDVFPEGLLACEQILEIRTLVNNVLMEKGVKLVFVPVAEKPFEFIPATSDPNSRTHALIERWGKDADGQQKLLDTVTASFQVNDSRPFANLETDFDRLELAKRIHNQFRISAIPPGVLAGVQWGIKGFDGRTRIEKAISLLTKVKAAQFLRHGFHDSRLAVIPPHFFTVDEMKKWMMAHSDVSSFEETDSKNEHALTCKIKRGQFWAVESRFSDAADILNGNLASMDRQAFNMSKEIHNVNTMINCVLQKVAILNEQIRVAKEKLEKM